MGIRKHEGEQNTRHRDTGLTVLPPPGRHVHAPPNIKRGRGVGTLEAPQDRHGGGLQDGSGDSGAMGEQGALEAMAELGALEAMAGGLRGLGLATRPGHYSWSPTTPTKKIIGGTYRAPRPSVGMTQEQ